MRQLVVCALLVSTLTAAGHAQDSRPQRFRGGVDLITIDVAAVDAKGRPVEDLKPGDFVVKVNGTPRPAVSAELITVERGTAAPARPSGLITTNEVPQNARHIIVAVDQTMITPGLTVPLQRAASEFIGRLASNDYAAFVAFPEPGPRVDFTTDKAIVRKELERIVGQPARNFNGQFNIGLWEAFEIAGAEAVRARSVDASTDPPPTVTRVLQRGCRQLTYEELRMPANLQIYLQCRRDVLRESEDLASNVRTDATISMRALENVVRELARLDGPKTMILLSAGLVNDDPTMLNEVARLAALARTTINVIAVEPERDQTLANLASNLTAASSESQSSRSLLNRSFELAGLELIADRTNGTMFRGIAAGKGIFERLEQELSAWYVVAVERQRGDPDTQRLEVEIKRRGVRVRSNKTAVAVAATVGRSLDEQLSDLLSSRFAIAGLPLRVATFAQRDADPTQYRVRVAAEVGQPGEPTGEFALGYVLTDDTGHVLTSAGSRRTLTRTATGSTQALQYDTSLAVGPGSYLLRFGVVDTGGRRGSVVRRVQLPKLNDGDIQTGDLVVGNLPPDGGTLPPRVEPQITSSELAAYLELYLRDAAASGITVTLDIAEGESSSALATQALTLGETPSARVAFGFVVTTAITPGRYIARATVRRDGTTVKTLTRPIAIVRDPSVVSRVTPRTPGVPLSAELHRLAAGYVAGVVDGLANVVAQEDFRLSKPDRRVTSDLLLVRYPGTKRDLIPYRDVSELNGKVIEGREQRLVDLFVKPAELVREQARQIMASGGAYVPVELNPMFVLAFLQSDVQWRFQFTVSDASSEWPRSVKAVSFVEVGRPTILRGGAFGDLDVPSRGTAWIEHATGRVLQTELEVGRGRSAAKMLTKFRLDDRLQITVPVEMRTDNPDGVATYTNFRRFGIETESSLRP